MVFFLLSICADLENLTNFRPKEGCDDPNYEYHFKLKCENCGEIGKKATWVKFSETVPIANGRATVNLVQKCKLCSRDGSIQMILGHGEPLTPEHSQAEKFAPLMVFDCRGFEPIDFSFTDGWIAESTVSGLGFTINFSPDGDFCEYDEKGDCAVGVSNLRSNFEVVKKMERHGKTTYR